MAYDGVIKTQSSEAFRAYATDSTTAGTSIAQPADTATSPSGDGIIQMGTPDGAYCSNGLKIVPYGVGTAGQTFLMSVFCWEEIHPKITQRARQWSADLLASFTCTLCTVAGLPGGEVDNTHLWVDTIALVVGNANVSVEVVSPTGNVKAHILLDAKGARKIGIYFAMNGSATAANAIARRL